jgi:hypothetical protein
LQTNGQAASVMVNGTDVYFFGGTQKGTDTSSGTPAYWKNGVLKTLPLPTSSSGSAFQGGFDPGGNLYVASRVTSTSTGKGIPGYWKNDLWNPLPDLSNAPAMDGSSSNGVFIDGSHVYFSGWLPDPNPKVAAMIPVYWKDGTVNQVSLTSAPGAAPYGGSVISIVLPPFTSSLTILLTINDSSFNLVPAYMVGSTITAVPTGAAANGVVWWSALSPSGDLYATGMVGTWASAYTTRQPAYWLNWSYKTLPTPDGQPYGWTGGAEFSGNDIYIDGTTFGANGIGSAVYWKNGVLNVLPVGTYIGAGEGGFIFD